MNCRIPAISTLEMEVTPATNRVQYLAVRVQLVFEDLIHPAYLHISETLGMAESLLGKWNRQYEQRGDSAKLRRLRQQQAQVTMERDVLKKVLAIFSQPPRSGVPRH